MGMFSWSWAAYVPPTPPQTVTLPNGQLITVGAVPMPSGGDAQAPTPPAMFSGGAADPAAIERAQLIEDVKIYFAPGDTGYFSFTNEQLKAALRMGIDVNSGWKANINGKIRTISPQPAVVGPKTPVTPSGRAVIVYPFMMIEPDTKMLIIHENFNDGFMGWALFHQHTITEMSQPEWAGQVKGPTPLAFEDTFNKERENSPESISFRKLSVYEWNSQPALKNFVYEAGWNNEAEFKAGENKLWRYSTKSEHDFYKSLCDNYNSGVVEPGFPGSDAMKNYQARSKELADTIAPIFTAAAYAIPVGKVIFAAALAAAGGVALAGVGGVAGIAETVGVSSGAIEGGGVIAGAADFIPSQKTIDTASGVVKDAAQAVGEVKAPAAPQAPQIDLSIPNIPTPPVAAGSILAGIGSGMSSAPPKQAPSNAAQTQNTQKASVASGAEISQALPIIGTVLIIGFIFSKTKGT